jgi:hypothetical protein
MIKCSSLKKFKLSHEEIDLDMIMRFNHRYNMQFIVNLQKGVTQMPINLSDAEKTEVDEKALSAMILCLGDKVLREVAKEKSVVALWTKLDPLYMTKMGKT